MEHDEAVVFCSELSSGQDLRPHISAVASFNVTCQYLAVTEIFGIPEFQADAVFCGRLNKNSPALARSYVAQRMLFAMLQFNRDLTKQLRTTVLDGDPDTIALADSDTGKVSESRGKDEKSKAKFWGESHVEGTGF